MPQNPVIVIGLGTSGSEIVAGLYQRVLRMEKAGRVARNLVQFLLIDSDVTPADAVDLDGEGKCLKFNVPNSKATVAQLLKEDQFFPQWWYPKFKDPGTMSNGCGSVPLKGRLGFWASLGRAAFKDAFGQVETAATNVVDPRGGGLSRQVDVYIVSSLSGGSGSGMLLDVAMLARQLRPAGTQIFGVFLLPSILDLRAAAPVRQHLKANALATLNALSYWMSQPDTRKVRIDWFMKYPGVTPPLLGDSQPFDLVYLIGAKNEMGAKMNAWPDYRGLVIDALSAAVLTPGSRLNDVLQTLDGLGEERGQPMRWGSLGVSGLVYDRAKTLDYLSNRYAELAINYFLSKSPEQLLELKANARLRALEFVKSWQIMEKSEDPSTPNNIVNQVIDKLRGNADKLGLYSEVELELGLRRTKNDPEARARAESLYQEQRQRLEERIKGEKGIPFLHMLQQTRKEWVNRVVCQLHADATVTTATSGERLAGIEDTLGQVMREEGLAAAEEFLTSLHAEIEAQKATLLEELNGDPIRGVIGETRDLKDMEDDDYRASQFARLKGKGGKADELRKRWWNAWLEARKAWLAKSEAVKFYEDLQQAIADRNRSLQSLRLKLAEIERTLQGNALKFVGGRATTALDYVLDDRVLASAELLDRKFIFPALNIASNSTFDQQTLAKAVYRESKALLGGVINEALPAFLQIGFTEKTSEIRRAENLRSMEELIKSELLQIARDKFRTSVEDLSLWMALAAEAELNKAVDNSQVVKYVMDRITTTIHRCLPFWPLDEGKLQGSHISPQPYLVADYNEEAKREFEARYNNGAVLPLDPILMRKLEYNLPQGQHREQEGWRHVEVSTDESKYVFRLAYGRAGITLDYLKEVVDIASDFKEYRKGIGIPAPVYTDVRYEQFDVVTISALEDRFYFLLAESLGVIKSPIQKQRISGDLYYGPTPLGNNRERAFASLKIGGENNLLFDEIVARVKRKLDQASRDQHVTILLTAYAGLYNAAMAQTKEYRDQLLADYGVIADFLGRDYGVSVAAIEEECEKRGIALTESRVDA